MNQENIQIRETTEPQEALAMLAWNSAPQLCNPEHSCQDYHRSWGLVRQLLGNGYLPAGEDFFTRELAKVVRQGGRRVLISGGADAGLLTIALKACRAAGIEPELVFADRCATACEVNARMAEAVQANVQLVQGDLCELDIAPVDAVLAHSFLLFFEGDKRQALLEAWSRNCQVGGTVLTSNVLKADEADWNTIKDGEALTENARKLREVAQKAGHSPELVEEMVRAAGRFWKISPSRPPGITESNLRFGLERAGFGDICINYSCAGVNDGPIARVRKPLIGKQRAEISAVKRNS